MRYIGSKASTVDEVVRLATRGLQVKSAADAFGGLGTMAQVLRANGARVTTCDVLAMPHAFQFTRIGCSAPPRYRSVRYALGLRTTAELQEYLNTRTAARSWLVTEFAEQRRFFLPENASRIAGAWNAIKRWEDSGLLSRGERCHLVASLINSADLCANTAGTYYAYLKDWHRKAKRPFTFELMPIPRAGAKGEVLLGDALECLRGSKFDLLYLDPPYTQRDYARYYHLPESLAQLRRPKTNLDSLSGVPRDRSAASEHFQSALRLPYLSRLVTEVSWKRLVVQYCDNSFIAMKDLRGMLAEHGTMQEFKLLALGYTTRRQKRQLHHHVFIIDRPSATAGRAVARRKSP
jgi:adenine-specific DNA-methyltransferase